MLLALRFHDVFHVYISFSFVLRHPHIHMLAFSIFILYTWGRSCTLFRVLVARTVVLLTWLRPIRRWKIFCVCTHSWIKPSFCDCLLSNVYSKLYRIFHAHTHIHTRVWIMFGKNVHIREEWSRGVFVYGQTYTHTHINHTFLRTQSNRELWFWTTQGKENASRCTAEVIDRSLACALFQCDVYGYHLKLTPLPFFHLSYVIVCKVWV